MNGLIALLIAFVLVPASLLPVVASLANSPGLPSGVDLARLLSRTTTTVLLWTSVSFTAGIGGCGFALVARRLPEGARHVARIIATSTAFAPLVLLTGGWLALTGRDGLFAIDQPMAPFVAAWLIHSIAALPWATAFVLLALGFTPAAAREHAMTEFDWLNADRRLALPMARWWIVAAALIAALPVWTDMSVTDLLMVRTLAEETYLEYAETSSADRCVLWSALLALGAAMLVPASTAPGYLGPTSRPSTSSEDRTGLATSWAAFAVVLVLAGLTIAGLVWQLGLVYVEGQPTWSVQAAVVYLLRPWRQTALIAGNLVLVTVAAALSVTIGGFIAWRMSTAWATLRRGVGMLAMASLLIPGPVLGLTLVGAFNQPGWLGHLLDSPAAPIYGLIVRLTPIAMLTLETAIRRLDPCLLEAARIEGASEWEVGWTIVAPILARPIAVTIVILVALGLGELPVSRLLAPPGWTPISLRSFELMHNGLANEQAAWCLVLMTCAGLLALLAWRISSGPIASGETESRAEAAVRMQDTPFQG